MTYLPDIYQQFEQRFPDVYSERAKLSQACYDAGPLDVREAHLVKLGIAIGVQSEGAVRSHVRAEGREFESLRARYRSPANVGSSCSGASVASVPRPQYVPRRWSGFRA
jgi:hypothetical protein